MNTESYRPEIGQTIFVSLYHGKPFLTTIMDYHTDQRFTGEQFRHTRIDGKPTSSSLDNATFYPNVPVDSKFLYVVVLDEHEFMEKSESIEVEYFFDPQSAFDYIDGIHNGTIKPRHAASAEFAEHIVQVEKI